MREVIVFTKVPERGHVKTRLQKRLPPYAVEELYTAFLMDTLDKLREYFPFVAYYPESKLQMLWQILGDRKYIVQRGADMGEKFLKVFGDFYKMGVHDIIVVGCDVPTLRTEHIREAFALMESNDLVLGPSHDGGFYLIGGKGVKGELFGGVGWDGPAVFETVKANAERLDLKVGVLPQLHDIDTPEDLDAVWASGELPKDGNTYRVLKKQRRA